MLKANELDTLEYVIKFAEQEALKRSPGHTTTVVNCSIRKAKDILTKLARTKDEINTLTKDLSMWKGIASHCIRMTRECHEIIKESIKINSM